MEAILQGLSTQPTFVEFTPLQATFQVKNSCYSTGTQLLPVVDFLRHLLNCHLPLLRGGLPAFLKGSHKTHQIGSIKKQNASYRTSKAI